MFTVLNIIPQSTLNFNHLKKYKIVPLFSIRTFILNMKGVDILKKVLIKIYVSPETKVMVKKVAKQKKKSQSTVLRHWVEDYLDTLVFPED